MRDSQSVGIGTSVKAREFRSLSTLAKVKRSEELHIVPGSRADSAPAVALHAKPPARPPHRSSDCRTTALHVSRVRGSRGTTGESTRPSYRL